MKVESSSQRLAGASLLILANKQDVQGALNENEIRDVSPYSLSRAKI